MSRSLGLTQQNKRTSRALPEAGCASSHDFSLADELGVEFAAIEGEVDVEIDAVEGSLRRVHALEILLEVLS